MGIYFNYTNKRMKKIFTSIVLALCISIAAIAQTTTINVQGQPRKISAAVAARVQKAAEATTSTGIDFSKIKRWAGEGDCQAALAIKWADGQNEGKTLVWGYRWKSSEQKTGEDLVRAVAKADPALYLMGSGDWGLTIGGIGYDADNDRLVSVTTMKEEVYPRCGFVTLPSDEYDTSAATDWGDGDAWNCGWFTGFWNYYVADKADDALQMSNTGATGRTLTDGCVDAYVFGYFAADAEPNVYDGNLEYLPATTDYSAGTFVLNEGSFGHEYATVNHLSYNGEWTYRCAENIGATGCFATAWANRYYIIAKQAKHKNAETGGGRITVCDANSMRVLKQIENIGGDNEDGRSFCGIDEHRAYVGTTEGIYELDLDNMEITKKVLSTENYNTQFGNMVRLGDYVYATEYGKNLFVIRCADNTIVKTIPSTAYSIIMSKDGSLWVSTKEGISRFNTEKLELESIMLGEGIELPASSAGAWTPDCFCASLQNNVIYWASSKDWTTNKVFKYDIDKAEASLFIDYTSDPDGRAIYGAALRVDPKTDCIYTSLVKGWTYNDNVVRKYSADGTQLAEYTMEANNWFPEVFVFPDTEDPVLADFKALNLSVGEQEEVDVDVTDADNNRHAIVISVEIEDNSVAEVSVKDGKLAVNALKEGSTAVTVKACSNGISTTATVNVTVTQPTGITGTQTSADVREIARFTIDGKRINQPQRGINIVKYSDGTVKKVIVK